jgi:hypothetical protein
MRNKSTVVVVSLAAFLFSVGYGFFLYSQNKELMTSLDSCQSDLSSTKTERDQLSALNRKLKVVTVSLASVIDDLNNSIDEAKGYTWGTYNEMGEALDSLETRN